MDSKGVDHALTRGQGDKDWEAALAHCKGDIDFLSEHVHSWEAVCSDDEPASESSAAGSSPPSPAAPPLKSPMTVLSVPKSSLAAGVFWSGARESPRPGGGVRDFTIGNGRLCNENLKPPITRTRRTGGLAYAYEQEEEESFCGVQ